MTGQTPSQSLSDNSISNSTTLRRLPAEWEKHARTFMVWPASQSIWGYELPDVRNDIAQIARAIAKYEPVVVLAHPDQAQKAKSVLGTEIEVISAMVDDLWARDTAPVFAEEAHKVVGIDFNFNGWGKKQKHANDAQVARTILAKYAIPRIQAPIVSEGGSLETDGQGTLLITESSVVNDNRNPGRSRDEIEQDLKRVLGIKKVIWLQGVRGKDITDAHVDALVRFVAPGVVILNRPAPGSPPDVWSRSSDQAKKVLQSATDVRGSPLKIIELFEPDRKKIRGRGAEFLASYVNYYVANGAVIVPQFGDEEADKRAQQILRECYPGRDIVPVEIDTLASGGGGIHCATHDQPETPISQH
ncbi:uncharacterized protein VTP21DRAFT_3379 [Calcarisporiella thermophila]|uniref:uncharacterized protein n=1 Tax=Calcarisporiella thermophila TaxID=911321 RepID=UPI003742FC7A